MNKLLLGISTLLFSSGIVIGQNTFNPSNAREGENVEYCHQHTQLNNLRINNPTAYQRIMEDQRKLEKFAKENNEAKAGTVYTIPVVFHILHVNGEENISNEQIYDVIEVMNRDYRRLNSDANTVHASFQGLPADVEIEFKLATIAPNGQCFNGVTRTVSTLTNNGSSGSAQLQAVFDGNDVSQGIWAHNKYLNVVVAANIGGAAGYTQYPNDGWFGSNPVFSNTIWVLHNYVGRIGTSNEYRSRTMTHEVGHWLNLAHTWGNSNTPGLASNCSDDDGVADTPNTIGVQSCNLNENSCGPLANVENYMDYSYCSKMFTPGQASRMRTAIQSPVGRRNEIWTTTNLTSVGAIANPPLCKAEFSVNKTVICAGQNVQFSDQSYNTVTGWSWSFPGGTPSTSNSQNPSVTYSSPGVYQVSLTATQGSLSRNTVKTAYITVLDNTASLPFFEGFESYNTLADAQGKWFISNPENNAKFEVTNTAGHTGSKSVKLQNYGQNGDFVDELISSTLDLSNESLNDVTLSFRYAYRKRQNSNSETLRVFFSSNCGDTWVFRRSFNSNTMSSNLSTVNSWTPTAADWKTVHMPFNTAAFNQYLTNGFRYKFVFESNNGNNFYIDDINIYNGPESDNIVLGIENKEDFENVSLFPNPNDGEVNISFFVQNNQNVTLRILDVTGKELKSTHLNANTGENLVLIDNSEFSSGVYLIQLKTENSSKTLQFIKK